MRQLYIKNHPFNRLETFNRKDILDMLKHVNEGLSLCMHDNDELYFSKNRTSDNPLDLSFADGQAGILYYYLISYQFTHNLDDLGKVKRLVDYIDRHWKEMIPETEVLPWKTGELYGYFCGLGGIGSVLLNVYRVLYDDKTKRILDDFVSFYKNYAKNDENGTYWGGSVTICIDAGAILFLCDYFREFKDETVLDLINSSTKHLISSGIRHEDGGLELCDPQTAYFSEPDYPYKAVQPNFEMGASGAGYVLLRAYQETGDDSYLSAAKQVEKYLSSIAVKQDKGFLIPYRVGGPEEPVFYLGHCHGVAGTAKYYSLLSQIDSLYTNNLDGLMDGLYSMGAPERMSPGYWNNISVCCGTAGLLDLFTGLYQVNKKQEYLEHAKTCVSIILNQYDHDDKAFTMAFKRIKPDLFSNTSSYINGAAGIGAALIMYLAAVDGIKLGLHTSSEPFNR